MTHFNHEWNNANPAIPVSVGDRYYAQDLNDDFNYLKHLPYETWLQDKSKGVLIAPQDTLDTTNHTLVLSGGICAFKVDTTVLDTDKTFVIPPKTKTELRYERVELLDSAITLPQDNTVRYLVATPTKKTLLQRSKALLTEQWDCRSKYDSSITISDTTPTANQIVVGIIRNDEYLLLEDNRPDQCKDTIFFKCWKGTDNIYDDIHTFLKLYYDTSIETVTGEISMSNLNSNDGISQGEFKNCKINCAIHGGTFDHCQVSGKVKGGTFNYCKVSAEVIGNGDMNNTIFNYCEVTNVLDTANYSANNSFITYPNPQVPITTIRVTNCIVKIEEAITDRAFNSFKDCILTNTEVRSKNDAPVINTVDTYRSSFVTWFKNDEAPQQLCSGIAQQAEGIVPTGVIVAFGGDTAPYGWWICDGSEKSRSEYNKLFTKIGVVWGVGDGVSTFNIPDLRETAPVGVGQSSKTNRHDVFTLGAFKDDQFQNHNHSASVSYRISGKSIQQDPGISYVTGSDWRENGQIIGLSIFVGNPNSGNHGDITRGKRSGVNFIIRWL